MYTVSINNSGWIKFNEYDIEIEKCMRLIGEAIQCVHEIVHLNEYPNRIENAGKEYFAKKVKCISCNQEFLAPFLLLGDKDEFKDIVICPLCGKHGCEVMNTIKLTEVDYGTQLGQYFEALERLNDDKS